MWLKLLYENPNGKNKISRSHFKSRSHEVSIHSGKTIYYQFYICSNLLYICGLNPLPCDSIVQSGLFPYWIQQMLIFSFQPLQCLLSYFKNMCWLFFLSFPKHMKFGVIRLTSESWILVKMWSCLYIFLYSTCKSHSFSGKTFFRKWIKILFPSVLSVKW